MAKDKNHSSKNQNAKNHRNGIKKPKSYVKLSFKGTNQKYLRNRRMALLHDPNAKLSKNLKAKMQKPA
jgi:large subunit ribosomal protein L29e